MRIGAVAAPGILSVHADVGEVQHGQSARRAMFERIARILLEIVAHDVVHPIGLLRVELGRDSIPFADPPAVEVPSRQDDLSLGKDATIIASDFLRQSEIAVGAPGSAFRAGASAAVVGPDAPVVQANVFECLEFLLAVLQFQFGNARFARTEFGAKVVDARSLFGVVVGTIDRAGVGAKVRGAIRISLVAYADQACVQAKILDDLQARLADARSSLWLSDRRSR